MQNYPLLNDIHNPRNLRSLKQNCLPSLAQELRQFLLHSVAQSGGHLAANLGVIELTIALHYVFNTPEDILVWDVGHQSYPHKILTERKDKISTIRQYQGLAPFPKRHESIYDSFGVGHSSTSISAALGMAMAAKAQGKNPHVTAIIGDGAMTAGMVYEALNHAGDIKANMLVILNDNEMSISENVGALSSYLTQLRTNPAYVHLRKESSKVLQSLPPIWELAKFTKEHVKNLMVHGSFFNEMGWQYFGPIDGHDLDNLIHVLQDLKDYEGPKLLHVVTQKGKGYPHAENNPVQYHGVKPFDIAKGLQEKAASAISFSEVFGQWLCDMAAQDENLQAITPAMCEGSGMQAFAKLYPKRYHDVAIAEQHAVTLAAGMACQGQKPVVAIYSTFLQRAYDQLIHDVAIQKLPVVFAIDRAGIVGPDGPTHAGSFDISFLRCIPYLVIMTPSDENECYHMFYTGYQLNMPSCIRYPRGKGCGKTIEKPMQALTIGKGEVVLQGEKIALLVFGTLLETALKVAGVLHLTVVNMRFVKPLDENLIVELADQYQGFVTIEENAIAGGAGSAVSEFLAQKYIVKPVLHIGLKDNYLEHGSREILLALAGLDEKGITQQISTYYKELLENG